MTSFWEEVNSVHNKDLFVDHIEDDIRNFSNSPGELLIHDYSTKVQIFYETKENQTTFMLKNLQIKFQSRSKEIPDFKSPLNLNYFFQLLFLMCFF